MCVDESITTKLRVYRDKIGKIKHELKVKYGCTVFKIKLQKIVSNFLKYYMTISCIQCLSLNQHSAVTITTNT